MYIDIHSTVCCFYANIHMLPMLPSVKFKRSHHNPICHMKDFKKWHFWSKTDTLWNSNVRKTSLKIKVHQHTQKKASIMPSSSIFFHQSLFLSRNALQTYLIHNGFKLILMEEFIWRPLRFHIIWMR